jgi:hypothetical protein
MATVRDNPKKVGEKRTPITIPFARHLIRTFHGLRIQNLIRQAKYGLRKLAITVAVTYYRLVLSEVCL